jgi:hypothetical protein
MKCKNSYGIILQRFNIKRNCYEYLIVRRRITYAFYEFITSKYDISDSSRLQTLFNEMTSCEKIDILRGDYDSLYYKIYLQHPPKNQDITERPVKTDTFSDWYDILNNKNTSDMKSYLRQKYTYDRLMTKNKGNYVKNLINNSNNNGLLYEIPKGRKNNNIETNLECAIREFNEETGIDIDKYCILNKRPIIQSYVSNNVKYYNTYYSAITDIQEPIKLKFNNKLQISEVDEIRWFSKNEIKIIDVNNRITELIFTT